MNLGRLECSSAHVEKKQIVEIPPQTSPTAPDSLSETFLQHIGESSGVYQASQSRDPFRSHVPRFHISIEKITLQRAQRSETRSQTAVITAWRVLLDQRFSIRPLVGSGALSSNES
ncbi:hypothetical protein CEXT_161401 [Caerostris extrusa]|uniref:Uncharacterized protein n=1 Tax=Caerostris extrusa TaxID=172846 RepID=A0AAV4P1G8_CAEEX|nr:hypothetical protein CEXT_161401 [Caerostris extrusa]